MNDFLEFVSPELMAALLPDIKYIADKSAKEKAEEHTDTFSANDARKLTQQACKKQERLNHIMRRVYDEIKQAAESGKDACALNVPLDHACIEDVETILNNQGYVLQTVKDKNEKPLYKTINW